MPYTDNNTFVVGARVRADVNLVSRSIDFVTTNTTASTQFSGTYLPDPSWNLTGTLNWVAGSNYFSGTVSAPGRSVSGPAGGRFYGPNAEELGGVLNAQNAGGTSIAGSFGAARGAITP